MPCPDAVNVWALVIDIQKRREKHLPYKEVNNVILIVILVPVNKMAMRIFKVYTGWGMIHLLMGSPSLIHGHEASYI